MTTTDNRAGPHPHVDQQRAEDALTRWPELADRFTPSEVLFAALMLRVTCASIDAFTIARAVEQIRARRTPPTGIAYEAALARRNGRDYRGGPLCWEPDVACEGLCWDCQRPPGRAGEGHA